MHLWGETNHYFGNRYEAIEIFLGGMEHGEYEATYAGVCRRIGEVSKGDCPYSPQPRVFLDIKRWAVDWGFW